MSDENGRDVYFEFTAIGGVVKVSAIDATTGTEVSVIGPAGAAQADLEQALAVTKLKARHNVRRHQSEAPATTITGSLPRPHWFTENLNGRPFLAAFNGDAVYREQYSDAVAALIGDQTRAGLDIVTDGEMRFDVDIGGRSWFGYASTGWKGAPTARAALHDAVGSRHRGFAQRAGTAGRHHERVRQHRAAAAGGRTDRAGPPAIRRDLEDRAALHRQAGEDGKLLRADARPPGTASTKTGASRSLAFLKALNRRIP